MEPFDYQQSAVDEIVARGRAYFKGQWRDPSIRINPRFATLIAAPSGVGKSFIAGTAARLLGAKLVRISAGSWMPMGARATAVPETIPMLAEAIDKNERTLLAIDEICKISSTESHWLEHIRTEIFEILDFRWGQLKAPENDIDNRNTAASDAWRERITKKLRENVFVLGIGTFQEFFDSGGQKTIGYGASEATSEITPEDIVRRLPRELLNRFNTSLIRIPDLQPHHYPQIAKQAEGHLPESMRVLFRDEALRRMNEAIRCKKGFRFVEEVVMEVLKIMPDDFLAPTVPTVIDSIDPFDLCI